MTTLRSFDPADYASYKVTFLEDRFDEDTRGTLTIADALGPLDARNQVKTQYPGGTVLGVYELCRRCAHESHKGFCPHAFRNEWEWQPCGCGERAL